VRATCGGQRLRREIVPSSIHPGSPLDQDQVSAGPCAQLLVEQAIYG